MVTHVERASAPPNTPLLRRILHRGTHAAANVTGPPLARGERTLLNERDVALAPVVATTQALHHRAADGQWQRLDWSQVSRFSWEPRRGTLELTGFSTGPAPKLALRLSPATRLPAFVREQVLATILVTARVSLDDGTVAVVTARRSPASPQPTWIVRLAEGVDGDDPDLRVQIDGAVRDLRAQLGL